MELKYDDKNSNMQNRDMGGEQGNIKLKHD